MKRALFLILFISVMQPICWKIHHFPLNTTLASTTLKETAAAPQIIFLHPENGAQLNRRDIKMAISIIDPDSMMDYQSIKIYLDAINITSQIRFHPPLITHTFQPLTQGWHSLQLNFRTRVDTTLSNAACKFYIEPDAVINQKIYQLHYYLFLENEW